MNHNALNGTRRLSALDCDALQKTLHQRQTVQNAAERTGLSYDEEANIARLISAYESMMFVPVQVNLG